MQNHPQQARPMVLALLALAIVALLAATAKAHETDQYTLPRGREFADLSDYLTHQAYTAVSRGVEKQNSRIRSAVETKDAREAERLQSNDDLAGAVNEQF